MPRSPRSHKSSENHESSQYKVLQAQSKLRLGAVARSVVLSSPAVGGLTHPDVPKHELEVLCLCALER